MKLKNQNLILENSPPKIELTRTLKTIKTYYTMRILKLVTLFILVFSNLSSAQELTNWQVGINANPFLFYKLNTVSYFDRVKQDFPNGFGLGVTIEKNWNERWGFKTGFEITSQNEKYFVNDNSEDNTRFTTSFKYYKIPLTVQYYIPINQKLFVTINQGVQVSILKSFESIILTNSQRITYSSDYGENIFFDTPADNTITYGDFNNTFYNKNLFGAIGSVGLKGFISDRISYSSNLRYEYDFTNSDKTPIYPNSKTVHNFRIGLEFGLQYNFSINDRFDKSPIKI